MHLPYLIFADLPNLESVRAGSLGGRCRRPFAHALLGRRPDAGAAANRRDVASQSHIRLRFSRRCSGCWHSKLADMSDQWSPAMRRPPGTDRPEAGYDDGSHQKCEVTAMCKPAVAAGNDASRRTILLKTVSIVAGAIVLAAPAARRALAQTKVSHEQAKYQDSPKNGQKCSTCMHFQPPSSCKLVADPIGPNGWCQFYGAKTG